MVSLYDGNMKRHGLETHSFSRRLIWYQNSDKSLGKTTEETTILYADGFNLLVKCTISEISWGLWNLSL